MKKRGIKKRVLAALMTACMVVGAVPGVSFADVGDGSAPGNSMNPNEISYGIAGNVVNDSKDAAITLSKTAKLTEDGKYEITLTVDAENAKCSRRKLHLCWMHRGLWPGVRMKRIIMKMQLADITAERFRKRI